VITSTFYSLADQSGNPKGISGAIYVTWSGDFSNNVERFAGTILKWKKDHPVK
jgi:hypothetical protein